MARRRATGYSGTPLPKKLGIKEGQVVVLAGAPQGFEATLGPLPRDVRLKRRDGGARDLTLWFVRSRTALRRGMPGMAERAGHALWVCWLKQGSPLAGDVSGNDVREAGLAAGLVDFKVCAVDADWSGLRFARRRR